MIQLLSLSVLSLLAAQALAIKLRIRDKECFYKYAPEIGDKVYGSFVTQRLQTRAYYHTYVDLHVSVYIVSISDERLECMEIEFLRSK